MMLAGKTVLVTGGGGGIGRALALRAAGFGALVHVVDIEGDPARSVANEIERSSGKAIAHQCDVSNPDQVTALFQQIDPNAGLDLLFANAGVLVGGSVEQTRIADAEWVFSVNVMGIINCVQAGLPLLRLAAKERNPARIVLTGSENSVGLPVLGPTSVYTASKHAVLGLGDALRRDLADEGIEIAVLCPGMVATEIFDARRNRPQAFGGSELAEGDAAERTRQFMARKGQDPALTARLCFEGVERGDFIIITDPDVRIFAERRWREVKSALDRADASLVDKQTPR